MTRSITFPKTGAGEWTNVETNVVIVKVGQAAGGSRYFVDVPDAKAMSGYRTMDEFDTLAEARIWANYYANWVRGTVRRAREEAYAIKAHLETVEYDAEPEEFTSEERASINEALRLSGALDDAHAEALVEDAQRRYRRDDGPACCCQGREKSGPAPQGHAIACPRRAFILRIFFGAARGDEADAERLQQIEQDHAEALAYCPHGRPAGDCEWCHPRPSEMVERDHAEALIFDAYVSRFKDDRVSSSYAVGASYDMVWALHRSVVESAHAEALIEDAERWPHRAPTGCTVAYGWTEPHLYDDEPVELDRDSYDEYERCGRPADDPLHIEGAHAVALVNNSFRERAAQNRRLGWIDRVRDARIAAGHEGRTLGLREAMRAVRDEDHAKALAMDAVRVARPAVYIENDTVRGAAYVIGSSGTATLAEFHGPERLVDAIKYVDEIGAVYAPAPDEADSFDAQDQSGRGVSW